MYVMHTDDHDVNVDTDMGTDHRQSRCPPYKRETQGISAMGELECFRATPTKYRTPPYVYW